MTPELKLTVHPDDLVLDDGALLADRILRSLHRNDDGHLGPSYKHHENMVDPLHNVAVLYVYTVEDDAYSMYEHYVYSHDSHTYRQWKLIAHDEVDTLNKQQKENFHGVYGWSTGRISITPLRTGDLFIKIDAEGARGVRLAFGTREDKHAPRKKAAKKQTASRNNRV